MFMPEDAVSAFRKNSDGSWTCIKPTMIFGYGGIIHIESGMTFERGVKYWGVDMVAFFDENITVEKPE